MKMGVTFGKNAINITYIIKSFFAISGQAAVSQRLSRNRIIMNLISTRFSAVLTPSKRLSNSTPVNFQIFHSGAQLGILGATLFNGSPPLRAKGPAIIFD